MIEDLKIIDMTFEEGYQLLSDLRTIAENSENSMILRKLAQEGSRIIRSRLGASEELIDYIDLSLYDQKMKGGNN